MKKYPLSFGPLLPKALFFVFVAGLVQGGCTRRDTASHELPSGRFVQPEVPVTPAQSQSLSEELELQLVEALSVAFNDSMAQIMTAAPASSADSARVSRVMAMQFAKDIVGRVQSPSRTDCVSLPEKTAAYLSCLVYEVVDNNLASAADARRWVEGFAAVTDKAGKNYFSRAEVQELADGLSLSVFNYFSEARNVERLLVRLNRSVDAALRALEILASQNVSLDMPYVSESFVKNRRYVLTTSLQQGSVGSSRVFNLDSMIVRLQINSNRLIILREGEGLYSGSSQEDLVVGSYPIVRTLQPEGQSETFYQIDFSRPENKSFLVSGFAPGEPSLQMSADVVVPRIAHAAKPAMGGMTNGLYFTKSDSHLVVDQLVLLNSNAAVFGDDESESSDSVLKDPIRPTVHLVQGFVALPSGEDSFAVKQAIPVDASQGELRARGVDDQTQGRDVPYFTTPGVLEDNGGRARTPVSYVRKFNLEKEIVFVLSRNVPAAMVPVLKSAVLSFKELFDGLASEKTPAPVMRVLTQDEFEDANHSQGFAIGGSVSAADPRVNMIYWDDSLDLGSAWATASENPKTGEIISGDVMLSGSMWAMEGCKGYFQRTWQKDKEPNLPKRPAGTVPSPVSRFMWEAKCDAALSKLGIFKSRAAPVNEPSDTNTKLAAFDRANRTGDLETLARLASETLGRSVKADEMVSQLNSRSGGTTTSVDAAAELRTAFAKVSKDSGHLQTEVQKRVSQLEGMFAADNARGVVKSLASGKNVVRARLDCVRGLMPNADINLSEAGMPGIESPFVTSPETGAMALVRSVVVHELGHVFGLRHNFIASTTTAVLAEDAKTPVAIEKGTDSVMDYNDYGIEMNAGAMRDFANPEGALGLATFGAYDVLALATAYGYSTEAMKFKSGPAFCTDRNVSTFGNCQRFDFGKDYNEFMLHRVNLILQRLRYANPLDAILDPRLPGIYAQQIKTLSQELLKISALWGISQSAASETTETAARDAFLQNAEFAFRGAGAKQDFLKAFPQQYGVRLLGAFDALQLSPSFFASPEYGALISTLVRKEMDLNLVAVVDVLQKRARGRGSDSAYLGVISNLNHRGSSYAYLNDLMSHFGSRVVVAKDSPAGFDYLYDGQRKSGVDATLDGKPFQLMLETPLFNHQSQILVVPNVVLDGPAPGSRKTVTALVKGIYSIDDMMRSILALSVMALDNPLHPARELLAVQAQSLQGLLQENGCATTPSADDSVALAACETLKVEARGPAAVILNSLMASVQGALPMTSVASGDAP